MLLPKKVKFRKWQTSRRHPDRRTPDTRGITIAFGSYALKAMSASRVRSQQIEAARKALVHHAGKSGKVWIRIFPDRPFTQKPAEVKMGKGKGEPQGYQAEVFPGRIIFEMDGVTAEVAKEALRKAGTKLPLKTRVIAREA